MIRWSGSRGRRSSVRCPRWRGCGSRCFAPFPISTMAMPPTRSAIFRSTARARRDPRGGLGRRPPRRGGHRHPDGGSRRGFRRGDGGLGVPLERIFYCAESVLLPEYRGQGIGHRFFEAREDHARALGRTHCAFCGVVRAADHPARPETTARSMPSGASGAMRPVPGAVAQFRWKEVGHTRKAPTTCNSGCGNCEGRGGVAPTPPASVAWHASCAPASGQGRGAPEGGRGTGRPALISRRSDRPARARRTRDVRRNSPETGGCRGP